MKLTEKEKLIISRELADIAGYIIDGLGYKYNVKIRVKFDIDIKAQRGGLDGVAKKVIRKK